MKRKSILVTGGAGYIGSHVALELLARGERVVVLDNFSTGTFAQAPAGAKIIRGDVRDAVLLKRIIRAHEVDSILHFAGLIVTAESVVRPLEYYDHNVGGTRALVGAAVACGVKHLIYSSSAAVYGKPTQARVPEDAPLQPISPYGFSKAMGEQIIKDAAKAHGVQYVILRYFNVAGADSFTRSGYGLNKNPSHLMPAAIQAAAGKLPYLELFGDDYDTADGTCIRDYVHVSDLARAHVDALHYLKQSRESAILNCGYGKGFSVREVIDAVRRKIGRDFDVRVMPRRAGDAPLLVADPGRICEILGWVPRYNYLPTIIKHEYKWFIVQQHMTFIRSVYKHVKLLLGTHEKSSSRPAVLE